MRRRDMAGGHDRISELPDPILEDILSLMPIKPATRTSILSSRWRDLWKHIWTSATTLDFTGELASRQTPDQLVACIDRYLRLHTGKKIRSFRLSLHPADLYEAHLEQWIEFAASRCAEELDLDFCPPYEKIYNAETAKEKNLFRVPRCFLSSGTLTHLTLSYCDICPPVDFSGLPLLRSLSLRRASIDDFILRGVLSNCLFLEVLSLTECTNLSSIEIPSVGTRLKRLVLVDCWDLYDLKVSAPSMESFHFSGEIDEDFSFDGASGLIDAFICSIFREFCGPQHDYVKLLSRLAHVRVLTVCPATLMCVTYEDENSVNVDYFPVRLENLRELQLLVDTLTPRHLFFIYGFFRLCPSPLLEKLFIRLPKHLKGSDLSYATEITEGPQNVPFDNLKVVKMSSFKGTRCEMALVKFILGKAANLERLVLVTPSVLVSDNHYRKLAEYALYTSKNVGKMGLKEYALYTSKNVGKVGLQDLYIKLLSLHKASPHVQIVLSKYSEDDSSLKPTHPSLYCDAERLFSGW